MREEMPCIQKTDCWWLFTGCWSSPKWRVCRQRERTKRWSSDLYMEGCHAPWAHWSRKSPFHICYLIWSITLEEKRLSCLHDIPLGPLITRAFVCMCSQHVNNMPSGILHSQHYVCKSHQCIMMSFRWKRLLFQQGKETLGFLLHLCTQTRMAVLL